MLCGMGGLHPHTVFPRGSVSGCPQASHLRAAMVMPAGLKPILLLLVLVLCQAAPSTQEPQEVQLRLAGPRGPAGEGRLEVLYQGRWGTVCDDGFDFHVATVACRQLGYTAAITWTHSATYGQGEGRGQLGWAGGWMDNGCWGKPARGAAGGESMGAPTGSTAMPS